MIKGKNIKGYRAVVGIVRRWGFAVNLKKKDGDAITVVCSSTLNLKESMQDSPRGVGAVDI